MKIEPTTERLIVENYQSDQKSYLLYLMHVVTYKYSLNYVAGKKVLDYGCGSGYGTALIGDASSHFSAPNLSYLQIERTEVAPLPFPDSSFDVVLSFQVIEHVEDVSAYLREIDRVLAPGGSVIIATPDRSTRLFSFQKPWNMWHLREYSQDELNKTMTMFFSNVFIRQMGGRQEVLKIELDRTKQLKWIMLPFTLPFIPEIVRVNCLRLIKYLGYRLSRHSSNSIKPDVNETALRISDSEKFSVNLVAIANKTVSG